jgi:hypothetical protein
MATAWMKMLSSRSLRPAVGISDAGYDARKNGVPREHFKPERGKLCALYLSSHKPASGGYSNRSASMGSSAAAR